MPCNLWGSSFHEFIPVYFSQASKRTPEGKTLIWGPNNYLGAATKLEPHPHEAGRAPLPRRQCQKSSCWAHWQTSLVTNTVPIAELLPDPLRSLSQALCGPPGVHSSLGKIVLGYNCSLPEDTGSLSPEATLSQGKSFEAQLPCLQSKHNLSPSPQHLCGIRSKLWLRLKLSFSELCFFFINSPPLPYWFILGAHPF